MKDGSLSYALTIASLLSMLCLNGITSQESTGTYTGAVGTVATDSNALYVRPNDATIPLP
jgi:hypothetical protein